MLIILFLVVISLVSFFYCKKYMDIVDKILIYPFVIYTICCLVIVSYVYYGGVGYGERESFNIATTLLFTLMAPPLIFYVIIKALVDIIQNIKMWKICNAIFLCISIYLCLIIFGVIQKPILLPKWTTFFIVYRMFFVYISIALILYTIIRFLMDIIQNFKVWRICNVIFLCILIYCLYTRLENIKTGHIFSTFLCHKDDNFISCKELGNE